mgnify:FL=1
MLSKLYPLSDKGSKALLKGGVWTGIHNLCTMLPVVLLTIATKEMIKNINTNNKVSLLPYLGSSILIMLVMFVVYKRTYHQTYINSGAEGSDMRVMIAEKIRKLPLSYIGNTDLSDLTSTIMDDAAGIEKTLSSAIPEFIGGIISSCVILAVLFIYDYRMAFSLAIWLPIALVVVVLSKSISTRSNWKLRNRKLVVSDGIQEYLDNIKIIQSSPKRDEYQKSLDRKIKRVVPMEMIYEFVSGTFVSIAYNVLRVGIGFVIITGSYLITHGEISIFDFMLFIYISVRIYEPLSDVCFKLGEIIYSFVGASRVNKTLNYPEQGGSMDISLNKFDIVFDHVSFSYDSNEVINDVCLTAKQGEMTALVGPSGSGKSTLCRLACRFWDVSNGSIKIDGKDIRDIAPEKLLSYFSIVFQDVVLFNDTIYNNIKIGKENATKEEVMAAARLARCDDFVNKLPNGYDTVIGENGKTLSGGERQRLSIARAFLKNAPIILLDESTASLDPENETLIQQAIGRLIENKTVLIIAHRMRAIQDCDKIVVLKEGKIEECGSHKELMKKKGLYNHLYNIQKESMNWTVTK